MMRVESYEKGKLISVTFTGTLEEEKAERLMLIDRTFREGCDALIPDTVTEQSMRLGFEIDPNVAEKMDEQFAVLVKERAAAVAALDKITSLKELDAIDVVIAVNSDILTP